MSDACRQVEYPALGRTVLRPTRYRRVNRDDPAPWTLALIRLWEQQHLDEYIADVLSNLSAAAICQLERAHTWGHQHVTKAMVVGAGGRLFTSRQITHYRERLGLRGYKGRVMDVGSRRQLRAIQDAEYQRANGWGYLLPAYDEDTRQTIPGCELRRREVDILSTIREHGPMTRLQLCRALGSRSLNSAGRAYLRRLCIMRLLYSTHKGRRTYNLTQKARQPDPLRSWQSMCLK